MIVLFAIPAAGNCSSVDKTKSLTDSGREADTALQLRLAREIKERQTHFSWPLERAFISSIFGRRRRIGGHLHTGLDLVAARGTPVHAIDDGVVIFSGWMGAYGRLVIVRHEELQSYYAHNSALKVRYGQRVKRGDLIAETGRSGRVTGAHLHFEIRRDGKPINPLFLLQERNDIEYMYDFEQRVSLQRREEWLSALRALTLSEIEKAMLRIRTKKVDAITLRNHAAVDTRD